MRQKGRKIILLCTGILILVLSVLPHHHHCDGTIRFSVVEQCSDCHRHPAEATHHHPDTGDDCDLRQLFIMSGRDDGSHQHCQCHDSGNVHSSDHFVFTLLYALTATGYNLSLPDDGQRIKYPPFIAAQHGIESGGATGLRAPPVFIA